MLFDPSRITALRNVLCLIALLTVGVTHAQNQSASYYVVVGVFAVHDNAIHFTDYVLAQNYPARYAFNATRKLYYVYVRFTADKQSARQLAYHLRLDTEFKGAWIYQGSLEGNAAEEANAIAESNLAAETGSYPTGSTVVGTRPGQTPANAAAQPIITPSDTAATAASTPAAETTTAAPVGKSFVFQLTTGPNNTPVKGLVYLLQDAVTKPLSVPADGRIIVPRPPTGKLVAVSSVIGYKLARRVIAYDDPVTNGASLGDGQEIIIPINLVPVKKGDYIELEHVKFYEHSAIFTPESENELLQLVNLMSNPRCKVRLYGHTSSNEAGDIITMGSATNFFALDPAGNHTSHGSAKDLSLLRAEAVKAYLVGKGCDPGRISTKGYGALLAVYEQAAANDRIEIEILKN